MSLYVLFVWSLFTGDHLSLCVPLPPDFPWKLSLDFGRDVRVGCHLPSQASRTNRKADFTLVLYGLFVLAGAGRESWCSVCVTCSALLAFLSTQFISQLGEAAISRVHLHTPAVLV